MENLMDTLFNISLILICGMIAGRVATFIKVPDIVMFLGIGILVGSYGLGIADVSPDSSFSQLALTFGAAYIIFEGGSSVSWRVIRGVFPTIFLLATIGVLVTMFVIGYFTHWMFGVSLLGALLLGAIISATDPATIIPIFKQVKISPKVSQTAVSESAFNDATSAIAFFMLLPMLASGADFSGFQAVADLVKSALGGVLVGALFGLLGVALIAHKKYNFFLEYAPLFSVFTVVSAYQLAEHFHVSGFMAVFVAGICFGNINEMPKIADQYEDDRMYHFVEVLSLGLRMAIFILLGSQIDLALVGEYLWQGVAVAFVLMFIARPAIVFLCALPDRKAQWRWRELLFLCWTRETGVIPAALSGVVVASGIAEAKAIASIVFVVILVTIILQASTTKALARELELLEE